MANTPTNSRIGQVGLDAYSGIRASASSSSPFVINGQVHHRAIASLNRRIPPSCPPASLATAASAPLVAAVKPSPNRVARIYLPGELPELPDEIWEHIARHLDDASIKPKDLLSLSLTCTQGDRIFKWVIYGNLTKHPLVEALKTQRAFVYNGIELDSYYLTYILLNKFGRHCNDYSHIQHQMNTLVSNYFFYLCHSVSDPELRDEGIQKLKKWVPWFNGYILYGPIVNAIKSEPLDWEMIELLAPQLSQGEIISTALVAIQMKNEELSTYFLNLPELRNVDSLLEAAVESNLPNFVARILSSGKEISKEYDPNAGQRYSSMGGLHPSLLKAAQRGHLDCLEMLLTRGHPDQRIINHVRDRIGSLLDYTIDPSSILEFVLDDLGLDMEPGFFNDQPIASLETERSNWQAAFARLNAPVAAIAAEPGAGDADAASM